MFSWCKLTYDYPNGVKVYCSQAYPLGVTFYGEKGKIFVNRRKITSTPGDIIKQPLGESDVHLYVSKNHAANFLDCIKNRKRPICDVEIGHRSVTVCHLGNIAGRLGRKFRWDAAKEQIPDDKEANAMLARPYRALEIGVEQARIPTEVRRHEDQFHTEARRRSGQDRTVVATVGREDSVDREDVDPPKGSPVFTVAGKYTARGWTEWTQGFQYGSALLQFDATGDAAFLEIGRRNTVERMAPHVSHVGVHDHGFNNVSTYGNLLRLMNEGRIAENAWERQLLRAGPEAQRRGPGAALDEHPRRRLHLLVQRPALAVRRYDPLAAVAGRRAQAGPRADGGERPQGLAAGSAEGACR